MNKEIKTSKASELSEYLRENYPVNKASISQRKLKYGVGINNADYLTQPRVNGNQIKCPVYVAWSGILMRVYYENKRKDNLAYADCKVCDEWLTFNNFREWYIKNHVDGYEIDKDLLLPKNKIYSPDTCIFVPAWLNSFTVDCGARRGKYLIGVTWNDKRGKFIARCHDPKTKKQKNLGGFLTEQEAYTCYLTRKLEIASELRPEMDKIDVRIYPNVVYIIKNHK